MRNHGYTRLSTQVGVDDSAHDRAHAVTFMVYGDGKLLAKSKAMRWGQAAQTLTLDVSGAKVIELVARSTGGDNALLPVTWGEAAVLGAGKSD